MDHREVEKDCDCKMLLVNMGLCIYKFLWVEGRHVAGRRKANKSIIVSQGWKVS